jgi:hypothetical protein
MSIQKNPDPRDLRYLRLVNGRHRGRSEDEIAADAGCESPAALYQQLAEDRFPVCRECGATHVKSEHWKSHEPKRLAKRGAGVRIDLPAAAEAIPIFQPVVDALGDYVVDLTTLRETYADERFEVVDRYETTAINDPAENTITYGQGTIPLGAKLDPPHQLIALIAAYVMEGKPLDSLLEKLHHSAMALDRQKLEKKVAELRLAARQVAKLIRGGTVRTGRQTEELESREQAAAQYITSARRVGVPEPEIDRILLTRGFSRTGISRLKKLQIDYPGQ